MKVKSPYAAAARAAAVGGSPVDNETMKGLLSELKRTNDTEALKLHVETRGKAKSFGVGPSLDGKAMLAGPPERIKANRFLKARVYEPARVKNAAGAFITAVFLSRSKDMDEQQRGKAMLRDLNIQSVSDGPTMSFGFIPDPMTGKATLGTTGATGGYVLPNNLVDDVLKPEIGQMDYSNLCTYVNGVAVRGVDQPFRTGAPNPATVINWGAQKELVDEAYGSYTATLGTFAKIYDIGESACPWMQ